MVGGDPRQACAGRAGAVPPAAGDRARSRASAPAVVPRPHRFTLVSNSDAHSPPMLGREACSFDTDLDYFAIRRALETGEGYGGTVEFFPEEGKYHMDGHRACNVRLEPPETRRLEGRCP